MGWVLAAELRSRWTALFCSVMLFPMLLFGTDGVRGRANQPPMTVETGLAIGRAAGQLFRKREGKHRVVIGKDTRLSCYMFENALIAGLCSMGVDTLMVGPLPTPGVAFITRAYRADAGIVISASHNPFRDNGIKFFSSEGFKFSREWEQEMEALVEANDFTAFLPKDAAIGRNTKVHDANGRYIEYVKSTFPKQLSLAGLTVALDCANGAAYRVAPLVFRELDAEVFAYGIAPDGLNINEDCGSLFPKKLQQAVANHQADVGIAFDGDGDRVVLIDEKGELVDGDQILTICAIDLQERGQLPNHHVVGTVMTNLGLVRAMEAKGIQFLRAPVGDRYVVEEMERSGAILGGEQSGHLIFFDHNTTGDGIVAALQVLRIMVERGKSLSELTHSYHRYPQKRRDMPVSSKPPLEQLTTVNAAISKVQERLQEKGRVVVRYSGTEMVCRVMVETECPESAEECLEQISQAISREIGGR